MIPFVEIVGPDGSKRLINLNSIDVIEDRSITVNGRKIPCIETYEELQRKLLDLDRRLLS